MYGQNPNYEETPLTFQAQDTDLLFRVMQTNESQALVGLGGGGKSNFIAHFLRREARMSYIKDRPYYHYVIVQLNPHHLLHPEKRALEHSGSAWAGYELMLNRLRIALKDLYDDPLTAEEKTEVERVTAKLGQYYRNMYRRHPLIAQSGLRRVEDAIEEVLSINESWRLVFILDEFEEFLRRLPTEFFQSLRGLRDDRKRRMAFMIASRYAPDDLLTEFGTQKPKVFESFIELFYDFTLYLRPLDPDSVNYVVYRYAQRYNQPATPLQQQLIIALSGQHAGLIRHCFLPVLQESARYSDTEQLAQVVVQYYGVYRECESMYSSLSKKEQETLLALAHGRPVPYPEAAFSLFRKHVLMPDRQTIRIPLLRAFMRLRK
ncbi:MAG: hypothetical protein HXY40_08280 [Chloroflexi bacterium]|nr:hypothetical protein [Chloroflexota bacterium]